MIICPKTHQHCPACENPCAPLVINPLALEMPKEQETFRGIIPSFLEGIAGNIVIEGNVSEKTIKATVTIPL